VFTNRGGQSILDPEKLQRPPRRQSAELVNKAAAEKYGYPLSLWLYDEGLRNR